jgi:hypothetical protein
MMGSPDTISSGQRDWQLICAKKFPFLIGMNHIAGSRLPPRRGMGDGAATSFAAQEGREK